MILAIDVGNTQTVFGLHDGDAWTHVWRRETAREETEDSIAAWLHTLFTMHGVEFSCEYLLLASVVPTVDVLYQRLAQDYFKAPLFQLSHATAPTLPITYNPPSAVGADRIANAIGALAFLKPPIVIVDFGTATTFDVIDATGTYVGGAIMPGLEVSTQALVSRTAKLPSVAYTAPESAIGKTTTQALQSGIMLGYSGAVDAIVDAIAKDLGVAPRVIATGGLGGIFVGLCRTLESVHPELTLEGLRLAHELSRTSAS